MGWQSWGGGGGQQQQQHPANDWDGWRTFLNGLRCPAAHQVSQSG